MSSRSPGRHSSALHSLASEITESIARLRRHLDDINISKESAMVLQDELRARAQAVSQEATYKLGVMAAGCSCR